MAVDIFQFWSNVKVKEMKFGNDEFCHPADKDVLSRAEHKFDLKCWPGCFSGPLKHAPIVLLYLSPGLSKQDRINAKTRAKQRRYAGRQFGRRPLAGPDRHHAAWKWWTGRMKAFGLDWELLQNSVAVLNIGAYHSRTLADTSILAALPSSRVTLDWAQSVLFPEAIAGQRIVICLRAARFWGLRAGKSGKRYGKGLFAPVVTRGGHMENKPLRREIVNVVRKRLARHK